MAQGDPDPVEGSVRVQVARPAARDAAQEIVDAYARDPDVARYMIWRPQRDVSETVAFLERCGRMWHENRAFTWTLWTDAGTLAGMIEARRSVTAVDIGYVLRRSFWRRGFTREAGSRAVRRRLGPVAAADVYRVWATCDVENVASARRWNQWAWSARGCCGAGSFIPDTSHAPRDAVCYAIVK